MARVLFLSNIPTPYQLDFLDQIALQHQLRAVFLWSTEQNRDWRLEGREWLEVLGHRSWFAKARHVTVCLWNMRPDAILIGGHRLPFAGLVKWLGILLRARVVFWLEKPLPAGRLRQIIRRWVWRFRLPVAYGVAALGATAVSAYAPFSRRILNLPYSIDISRYQVHRAPMGERPVRFLFVGQLIHRKGVIELLDAFASVSSTDAELTIAGSGELKETVESYIRRFPHIRFLGFVGPDALPLLYGQHDVFVAPSRHDGWAVVVCEAMAAGMPVIGTEATGAFSEYVRHGFNGYLCKVSVESIRDGILFYCKHRPLIQEHGNRNIHLICNSNANASNAAMSLTSWLGLSG